MSEPLVTLITNDDGIDSPGLLRLAIAARASGLGIIVAAPAAESSGSSASITATESDGRILVDRRRLEGLDGVPCYAVHAAPALISLIASHGAFGHPPGLVLSGVNRGANLGRAILHSGTVGAALTGGVNGGRGLAVSLDVGPDTTAPSWDVACTVAVSLVPYLLAQPAGTVLNLNVPDTEAGQMPELREAKLARFGIVQTTMTELDRHQIRLAVADTAAPTEPGSDAELLGEGYATVTAIRSVSGDTLPADFAESAGAAMATAAAAAAASGTTVAADLR